MDTFLGKVNEVKNLLAFLVLLVEISYIRLLRNKFCNKQHL